ncbi:MAG TPA: carbonic anhydrase [Hyphomonadaceae bacterium]|mgnify:CR=1 FL=1|jgi:carbonic anhydrase|nr:carbonic anhydrase [Hyphomonadaceae bacterium]HPN04508.1 carbonic anhydrase [Hyphomonadaceae bacterium]
MTVSIRASLLLSALAMAALTAAFVDPPETSNDTKTPAHPAHWSYGGEGGPEHWAELAPDNKACSAGFQQSPIDLKGAMTANVDAPHPRWTAARGGLIVNNGHTIQVDVSTGGSIALDGKDFALKQFHFHHPSEHTIDGKQYPLEVHFVHAAKDGDLAVVGVMFAEGEANTNLDAIWATAPAREGKAAIAFEIDPSKFVPAKSSAYRYEGSLTTPPCSETVHWTVMAQPQTVSAGQVAAFSSLFPWNARPVQPLNRRYVLKTSG